MRRSSAWERQTVDFALLVSCCWAQATQEPSRDRKWPIPRPQCVHTLHYPTVCSQTLENAAWLLSYLILPIFLELMCR